MIQRWTGTVQEFDGTNVCALLRDETTPLNPREVAIIPLTKMYGHQRHLRRRIRPGAVFTWTVRVHYVKRNVKGRKEVATSEFHFSQKRWTCKDIKRIRRKAETTVGVVTPVERVSTASRGLGSTSNPLLDSPTRSC
jgi:hypothetical protein